jgi:hypothetical protein
MGYLRNLRKSFSSKGLQAVNHTPLAAELRLQGSSESIKLPCWNRVEKGN